MNSMPLRNLAIIAHVDHGKTTLVDQMLLQTGVFGAHQVVSDRVMDRGDLERERGITILSKNAAVTWRELRINLVDTPGHADFGGEVERVLGMVDGVLLVVDAVEGPMPQTRFVLQQALQRRLAPVIVVNKVDRPEARCTEVVDEVLELFLDLGADESAFDAPVIFCSARQGSASLSADSQGPDLTPLFEAIRDHVPAPSADPGAPFRMRVDTIDYNDYVGRIAIGRIDRGTVRRRDEVVLVPKSGQPKPVKINWIQLFRGVDREEVPSAQAGDIVSISFGEEVEIGESLCAPDCVEPLPTFEVEAPTVTMLFEVNNSPLAGTEGKYVTSKNLRERLQRELRSNLALRVESTETADVFRVSGRGELHLSILIETMRREGYELAVTRPQPILIQDENGRTLEPFERVVADVPSESFGPVMEKLGERRGELLDMRAGDSGRTRAEFLVPSRGLFGFRGEFLTDTRGEGLLYHVFDSYRPRAGAMPSRSRGSMIANSSGQTVAYALINLEDRGEFFVLPGTKVYEGMVVGVHRRPDDLVVNPTKKRQLSNVRKSTAEELVRMTPPRKMSLEECIEFLADDELLEVTPQSLRIRKRILTEEGRKQARKKKA